jgi:phospholipid N-methyltransferase
MSFRTWLENQIEKEVNTVVIELGAGTGVPRLRMLADQLTMPLVRINLRESDVSHKKTNSVGLPMGALSACQMLDIRR